MSEEEKSTEGVSQEVVEQAAAAETSEESSETSSDESAASAAEVPAATESAEAAAPEAEEPKAPSQPPQVAAASHHDHGHGDHGHDDHGHGHEGHGHVASMLTLLGVLGALGILTIMTVMVTMVDLGSQWNFVIAMIIATVKAALVMGYFMHLVHDSKFNVVVFTSSFLFVLLFLSMAVLDRQEYQPRVDEFEAAAKLQSAN